MLPMNSAYLIQSRWQMAKYAQKGFFPSKTEKVNVTIEFRIFKLI